MTKHKIGWREANRKRKYQFGPGFKIMMDRDVPEWLWMTIFLIIFIAIFAVGAICAHRLATDESAYEKEQVSAQGANATPTRQEIVKKGVVGVASWYDYDLNGVEWSKSHKTCAVRDFKRYSTIRVTNLSNGKSVDCYVNDFGPEIETDRQIDLSSYAFAQIANLKDGLANVLIEEIN
jgi:rare lipoprotein A (peptidoglycan hydrolase)